VSRDLDLLLAGTAAARDAAETTTQVVREHYTRGRNHVEGGGARNDDVEMQQQQQEADQSSESQGLRRTSAVSPSNRAAASSSGGSSVPAAAAAAASTASIPLGSTANVSVGTAAIAAAARVPQLTNNTTPTTPQDADNNDNHQTVHDGALARRAHGDQLATYRLRMFFSLITCLIIPTGILLGVLLIWMMISERQDRGNECDQPLFLYAWLSLGVFLYSPHHTSAKRIFFGYDRERDGPFRPRKVVLFDRCYQICFCVYTVLGFSWVSNVETCDETSPHLFVAARAFVIVQCILLFLLLLPLVSLPCIFSWLMRQGFLSNVEPQLQTFLRRWQLSSLIRRPSMMLSIRKSAAFV
jgi:hypothetical protein